MDMKYSVLMSVYIKEKAEYLDQSLRSMVDQTVFPDEIVIVEDGPLTTELQAVIESYDNEFPGLINIVKLEKNGGLGNALNYGIDACRNELIARMDSDDIAKSDRCEKQLYAFKSTPELSIVGTQIEEFIGDKENVVSSRIVPTTYCEIMKFSRRRSPFNHPTVMYRKSELNRVGKYRTWGRKEDLDLFIRMLHSDCKAINLKESLLWYRAGEDNLRRRKTWVNCKEYIQIMWGFFLKGYIGLSDIIYVVVGQLAMYLMPATIAERVSKKYLRN